MLHPKKPKFYAVANGKNGPAIHLSWPACQSDVKGFPKAKFKSFASRDEASIYIKNNVVNPTTSSFSSSSFPKKRKKEWVNESKDAELIVPPWSKQPGTSHADYEQTTIAVMFDGGTRSNPNGVSGSGTTIDITHSSASASAGMDETYFFSEYLGTGGGHSNNEAEYKGLEIAVSFVLKYLQKSQHLGPTRVTFTGDSLLVINQMQGLWQVRAENLIPIKDRLFAMLSVMFTTLSSSSKIEFHHVLRKFNTKADLLSNLAMDRGARGGEGGRKGIFQHEACEANCAGAYLAAGGGEAAEIICFSRSPDPSPSEKWVCESCTHRENVATEKCDICGMFKTYRKPQQPRQKSKSKAKVIDLVSSSEEEEEEEEIDYSYERKGLGVNPHPQSFGEFERFTKKIGGKVLQKQGMVEGIGLGKNLTGVPEVPLKFLDKGKKRNFDVTGLGYAEYVPKEGLDFVDV